MNKIPIEKQIEFIEVFKEARQDYVEYADLLKAILNNATEKLGFFAEVKARAKTIASFSTKIISKDKYQNPLLDMTDLCGARVVVHFQRHVEKVCDFIKKNFEIDEANSLDQKSKLRVNEFGYRSIHYIITPKNDSILKVPIDKKFKSMKAEIQVRTLAEHVWADISHDRMYKTSLQIPEKWAREAARLSALLESADKTFGSMSQAIDSISKMHELQYEYKNAETEIIKFKTLISVQEQDANECAINTLKLSSIYCAMNDYIKAKAILKEYLDRKGILPLLKAKLTFEYGMVLAQSKCNDFTSVEYTEGINFINKSLVLFEQISDEKRKEITEELSYIYYRLACLFQNNPDKSSEFLEFINKAQHLMPENPLYFVTMMEGVVLRNIDMAKYSINLFKTGIEKAIKDLKELIEIGIEKVPAWFAIGRCYFFLGNETACINAYSMAINAILGDKFLVKLCDINNELALLGRLNAFDKMLAKQIQLYLNIAMFLFKGNTDKTRYKNFLQSYTIRKEVFNKPIVIVVGGATKMEISKIDLYRAYIEELMLDFKGTIISGGTIEGIPGLVGEVKANMEKVHKLNFELCAYLPIKYPMEDAHKSAAYDKSYEIDSENFSALDIFTCWADIISSGINPADVILIGIDGGEIATMEYKIALSLGAKVGLIAYSGRAVSDFLQNKTWKNHPNLLQLPPDPHTVWALVNQSTEKILTDKEIETLAPKVHEFYRKKNMKGLKPESNDVNKFKVLMPWDKLDPSLQNSNRKQVAFYEYILKRANLNIRKSKKPELFCIKDKIKQKDYDMLAKLEHARWNAERLLEGWKYGPVKDLAKKLNPCIVPWDQLDADTKTYDYEPVDNIPMLLGKIGYEVYLEK